MNRTRLCTGRAPHNLPRRLARQKRLTPSLLSPCFTTVEAAADSTSCIDSTTHVIGRAIDAVRGGSMHPRQQRYGRTVRGHIDAAPAAPAARRPATYMYHPLGQAMLLATTQQTRGWHESKLAQAMAGDAPTCSLAPPATASCSRCLSDAELSECRPTMCCFPVGSARQERPSEHADQRHLHAPCICRPPEHADQRHLHAPFAKAGSAQLLPVPLPSPLRCCDSDCDCPPAPPSAAASASASALPRDVRRDGLDDVLLLRARDEGEAQPAHGLLKRFERQRPKLGDA